MDRLSQKFKFLFSLSMVLPTWRRSLQSSQHTWTIYREIISSCSTGCRRSGCSLDVALSACLALIMHSSDFAVDWKGFEFGVEGWVVWLRAVEHCNVLNHRYTVVHHLMYNLVFSSLKWLWKPNLVVISTVLYCGSSPYRTVLYSELAFLVGNSRECSYEKGRKAKARGNRGPIT